MRIVGGIYRGARLKAPTGRNVRPTSVRTRGAIFNILIHGLPEWEGNIEGSLVLDVFCGTGALGIEALSRGARHVTFIDRDDSAMATTRVNASLGTDVSRQTAFLKLDATLLPLFDKKSSADIAFLDPPYRKNLAIPTLLRLKAYNWLSPGALVVLATEKDGDFHSPFEYNIIEARTYGVTRIFFLMVLK